MCCESRALDGSLSSLAKGGVTHRRRDERQHTAWFKYRRAWTNKTEPGEEEIEAGTDRERDERNVKTMDGCFAGCHVPARRENNLCFTSLVCFKSRVCVCVCSCISSSFSQNTPSHYKVKPKLIYYVFPLTGHYGC